MQQGNGSPPNPIPLASGGSVSRFPLLVELKNVGLAKCELVRHLSPLTVATLMKSLPIQNRVHRLADKFVYIETGLVIGAEKQKRQFGRGDLGFMVSNGSICIFIKDSMVTPMNHIGAVKTNLWIIESARIGDVISMRIE